MLINNKPYSKNLFILNQTLYLILNYPYFLIRVSSTIKNLLFYLFISLADIPLLCIQYPFSSSIPLDKMKLEHVFRDFISVAQKRE